jgi:hypothetical protein
MVMPNAGRTGNWRRRRMKGIHSVSEGVMLSRGMNTRWPFAGPREDLWVGPRARAKREHWMRKPRMHAYVRACV